MHTQTMVPPITLIDHYTRVRDYSEVIVAELSPEDMVVQPREETSPPKWHIAHVTWFFETFLLKEYLPGYQEYDNDFSYLFNSYYESVGDRVMRTDRGLLTRPSVSEVTAYRSYVDRHMKKLMQGDLSTRQQYLIELGINHEQQHQELMLTDIKYIFGSNPLFPAYVSSKQTREQELFPKKELTVPEGVYEVGYNGPGFHYDNEEQKHKVFIEEFSFDHQPVSNDEYLQFINDGGYQRFEFWLAEGWAWVNEYNIKAPLHWYYSDGEWKNFTLSGLHPLSPGDPVTHVSYFEADAYARWKGKRLMTESEWEVACFYYKQQENDVRINGLDRIQPELNTAEEMAMIGETWEWTASAYLPYPRFRAEKGAVGEYNGKFMVNQMVLRGGSCATPVGHIRPTYRNFFHAHERWQFTGIRLAALS